MSTFVRSFIFCLVVLVFGSLKPGVNPALADSLDWRVVPPDWRWVVHFDVDGIRQADGASQVLNRLWKQEPARTQIEAIAGLAGVDLKTDLHGVTFVGTEFDPDSGVVVIHARLDPQKLVALVASNATYRKTEEQGITLHHWRDRPEGDELTACFADESHLMVGKKAATVVAMAKAFTQGGPAAPAEFFSLSGRSGTYLQAHAMKLDELSVPFMSPLVRRSRRLTLAVGEQDGQCFLQSSCEVDGAETAINVRDALIGLAAIAKLHYADQPEYLAPLRGIQVVAAENRTTLVWSAPVRNVLDLLKKAVPRLREDAPREQTP